MPPASCSGRAVCRGGCRGWPYLGAVDPALEDASKELAPHRDIADIAQSNGEMANTSTFYGV